VTGNGFTDREPGVFGVSGQLTFQTVPQFLTHTDKFLQQNAGTVTIDMRDVTLADSAGLALMIEWQQLARAAKHELVFTNIPEQMRDLMRVNGLAQVFGI
jgi:phospholipid transport system transporter-binding protein